MGRRKRKTRLRESDCCRLRGHGSPKADDGDYVPCIFKARLTLIPMALAALIWLWRYFTLPAAIEKTFAWGVPVTSGIFLCYMAMMETNRREFPVFMQWGCGLIILGAVWINQIIGVQFFLLLFITWLCFALLTLCPYTYHRKGKKTVAVLIFTGVLIAGGLFYPITVGVFLNQYVREVSLSNIPAETVSEITLRQKDKNVTVTSPEQIKSLLRAWKLYPFDARAYRRAPAYAPEDHNPWNCTIKFKNGREQKFLLAFGLRRTFNSMFVKDESNSWPNPFNIYVAYQSPELYEVLQPLLSGGNGEQ